MSVEPERVGPMTDEEAELFRWLRFGQLPERVRPAEMVELVDVEPAPEPPLPPLIDHRYFYLS